MVSKAILVPVDSYANASHIAIVESEMKSALPVALLESSCNLLRYDSRKCNQEE